jgi:hypothetical protein
MLEVVRGVTVEARVGVFVQRVRNRMRDGGHLRGEQHREQEADPKGACGDVRVHSEQSDDRAKPA